MTTKKKLNIAFVILGALTSLVLAIWLALADGHISADEALAIGNKVTSVIEQVQGALDVSDAAATNTAEAEVAP